MEKSISTSDGQQYPLGFCRVPNETSVQITETVKLEIEELATISCINSKSKQKEILEKLTFLMSDRAANEKLANKYINEWRKEELGHDSGEVHALYCMAHTLLGFMRYGMIHLNKLQQSVIDSDGTKLGRDASSMFFTFKAENAAARAIRMTCELVGPNGDEKNGIRHLWMADCHRRNVRSLIGDYRDNR